MIIKRSVPWHDRSTLSRSAHVIARIGLALTGTACGLFVAQVSARIDLVGSVEAMLAMMLYGAAGFYLGIDLPRAPPDHHMHLAATARAGHQCGYVGAADCGRHFPHRGGGGGVHLQYRSG